LDGWFATSDAAKEEQPHWMTPVVTVTPRLEQEGGPHNGKTQVAITGGLVLGRFAVTPRIKLIIGGGYQKAVSSFYTFNHAWLLTARAAF
jgi:hypothetical protein